MTFPPGRYATLEGIEMTPFHVLDISTDFHVVHSRACPMENGEKGALICILVGENARVVKYRDGKIVEIIKEGEEMK